MKIKKIHRTSKNSSNSIAKLTKLSAPPRAVMGRVINTKMGDS